MQSRKPIDIPVVSIASQSQTAGSNCDGKETVVLRVLGDSMEPGFIEGEILIIQTGVPAPVDAFVIAEVAPQDFVFRQLKQDERGGWRLVALNPAYPDVPLASLDSIRGVVTHKRNARSRKSLQCCLPPGGN